ncbi:DUF5808 domain-containing protein [Promicromonospora soli]|uniref:DUF5808 domain-containing protein n=1 Tax=Promicromonospora soli TaxID=2035533 RepID=UPI00167AA62F|nr:DUF5808 domain-containing protein [Promicromonospora soli]
MGSTKSVTNGDEGTVKHRRGRLKKVIRLVSLALTAAAVFKELRTPEDERTWHGKVVSVVPYDFRFPTMARVRERMWNPEADHVLGPRVFGVGWTVNAGKVVALVRGRMAGGKTGA